MTTVVKNVAIAAMGTPKGLLFAAIILPGGFLALSAYLLAKATLNTSPVKPEANDN